MKIYISGKITGLPIDEAKAMFQAAEDFLIKRHHEKKTFLEIEVVNPFTIDHSKAIAMENEIEGGAHKFTSHDIRCQYMKEDLGALLNSDSVYMLKNWGTSRGARVEHAVAKEMCLQVEYEQ